MIALCIIIFTGGMETRFSEIRPVIGPGVVLATVGVVLTAFVRCPVSSIWSLLDRPSHLLPDGAVLLASTMASTDSASVFSILRTQSQGLRQNLRPLLSWSGSGDPVTYMLTVLLISMVTHGALR